MRTFVLRSDQIPKPNEIEKYKPLLSIDGETVGYNCVGCGRLYEALHRDGCTLAKDGRQPALAISGYALCGVYYGTVPHPVRCVLPKGHPEKPQADNVHAGFTDEGELVTFPRGGAKPGEEQGAKE